MMSSLSAVVTIYRRLQDRRISGKALSGKVSVDAELRTALNALQERGMFLDHCDLLAKPDGTVGEVEDLQLPRANSEMFAEDWNDLISSFTFRIRAPTNYFIASENFYSSEDVVSVKATRYSSVLDFIGFLSGVSDYKQETTNGLILVFINTEKLELEISYNENDLISTDRVSPLVKQFNESAELHKEQWRTIIRKLLLEMLKDVSPDRRFSHLLSALSIFSERAEANYALYVADFSFEKVLREVEEHKLDYTLKLNKTFSDIQNQVLAIPAALILVVSQLTDTHSLNWKNFAIVLGCGVFFLFVLLIAENQRSNLKAIKGEIKRVEDELRKQHQAIGQKIAPLYDELSQRYKQQKGLLFAVQIAMLSVFVLTSGIFAWYSIDLPTRNALAVKVFRHPPPSQGQTEPKVIPVRIDRPSPPTRP